jgi:hypothetical protein
MTTSTSITQAIPENPAPVQSTESVDRPAWLPEKFKTPEELANSYKELESKLGSPKPPSVDGLQAIQEPAKSEPFNFDVFYNEYQASGKLSDASYKTLGDKGFTKEFVDQYIEGQRALVDLHSAKAFEITKGKDEYSKMIEWAKVSLTPLELDAFNRGVSGNVAQMQMVVQGLYSRYINTVGTHPTLLTGGNSAAPMVSGGFRSTYEMVSAINDPRYTHDSGYREEVAKKIAAMR